MQLNNNYINHSHTFSLHNDECVESNLLKLMLEIGAPNYAYKNHELGKRCIQYRISVQLTSQKLQE